MIKVNQWMTTSLREKGLLQAAIDGNEALYSEIESKIRAAYNIENGLPFDAPYKPKNSPMAQFDESHKQFLKQERDV